MPATLELICDDPARGQRDPTPNQLHGLVSTLLAESDAAHQAEEKPWTAAVERLDDEHVLLRVGWLPSAPIPLTSPTVVRFGPVRHTVLEVAAEVVSYGDLASASAEEVGWELITPTWLSRSGTALPFPDPVRVLGRLVQRWNEHCPDSARIPERARRTLLDRVQLQAWSGRTWAMSIGHAERVGFVGRLVVGVKDPALHAVSSQDTDVELGAAQKSPSDAAELALASRLLAALSRFAEISGAGAQTTYGAGQLRVRL